MGTGLGSSGGFSLQVFPSLRNALPSWKEERVCEGLREIEFMIYAFYTASRIPVPCGCVLRFVVGMVRVGIASVRGGGGGEVAIISSCDFFRSAVGKRVAGWYSRVVLLQSPQLPPSPNGSSWYDRVVMRSCVKILFFCSLHVLVCTLSRVRAIPRVHTTYLPEKSR